MRMLARGSDMAPTVEMAPTVAHCVWLPGQAHARGKDSSARPSLRRQAVSRGLQPQGGRALLGAARRGGVTPTLSHCVWSLYRPMPEATSLRAVPSCAGRMRAAALSPEGVNFSRGGPVFSKSGEAKNCRARKLPGLCARPRVPAPLGFTLLELLLVVAIIAVASAGVSFALRDSGQTQLEREALRLAALLESGRSRSLTSGVPVRWRSTASGFVFDGLPAGSLPEAWLSKDVATQGSASLLLGPEPIIGPQRVLLVSASLPGRAIGVATDGVRPFSVQPAEAPAGAP